MNLFRVPLNLIVVLILLRVDSISRSALFLTCSALMLVSFYFARKLEQFAIYRKVTQG